VIFEEYDVPGLETVNGIAEVEGNYPSKGGVGEKAACSRTARATCLPSVKHDLSTPVPRAAGGGDDAQRATRSYQSVGGIGPLLMRRVRRP